MSDDEDSGLSDDQDNGEQQSLSPADAEDYPVLGGTYIREGEGDRYDEVESDRQGQ